MTRRSSGVHRSSLICLDAVLGTKSWSFDFGKSVSEVDNFDDNELHRIIADGSAGDISPVPVTREVAPWRTRWGIVSSFQNRNYMALCGQGGLTSDSWYVYTSTDAGSTWTLREATSGYRRVAIAGDTNNVLYLWGNHRSIAYSSDFGATISSKSGNLSTFIGPKDTNNEFVGICGG